ncbi:uncharacterized protein DFL_007056 [Arthrobotrys flagrans]|uniref:SPRY domain-containing protein n=1 Tax=Arthrobotrys flagrans TaxID=97331 RepID=A0A436ZUM2_ARTFL|nr:hypothetical protein DFL_007056 [Arthrobotrys flagrans]
MADPAPHPLANPSSYSDNERYFISSGKQISFQPIPTSIYRLVQTTESIKTKGTLWQLNPSSSDDPSTTRNTFDVVSNLPLFAARYDNPLVSGNDSKSIYWEFEITSLGYSGTPAGLAFGFVVKDAGSEAVASDSNGSLRPYGQAAAPKSLSGPSLLWNSVDGGVYDNGTKVPDSEFQAKVGDIVGLGVIFRFDPSIPMIPTRDVNDNPNAKAGKFSKSLDSKGNKTTRVAEVKDLVPVPTRVFVTINGEEKRIEGDVARTFVAGATDVFPVLMVSGPGVGGKVKIGEAVNFSGEGGLADAQLAAQGNNAHAGHKKSRFSKVFKIPGGGGWFGGVGMGSGGG